MQQATLAEHTLLASDGCMSSVLAVDAITISGTRHVHGKSVHTIKLFEHQSKKIRSIECTEVALSLYYSYFV